MYDIIEFNKLAEAGLLLVRKEAAKFAGLGDDQGIQQAEKAKTKPLPIVEVGSTSRGVRRIWYRAEDIAERWPYGPGSIALLAGPEAYAEWVKKNL